MDSKKQELAQLRNTLESVKDLLEGAKRRRLITDITEHLTFELLDTERITMDAPALAISWSREHDDIMDNDISNYVQHISKSLMWVGKVKELYKWKKGEQLNLRIKQNSDLNFTLFPLPSAGHGADIVIDKLGYVNFLIHSGNYYCRTKIEGLRGGIAANQWAYMRLECTYNDHVFNEVYDGKCQ